MDRIFDEMRLSFRFIIEAKEIELRCAQPRSSQVPEAVESTRAYSDIVLALRLAYWPN